MILRSVLFSVVLAAAIVTTAANAEERRFSESDQTNEAIIAARATLDLFWKIALYQPCGCTGATLAVRLPWEGKLVDVDVKDVERMADGSIEGTVIEYDVMDEPDLSHVRVTFSDDDIMDWGFGRDGVWYGLFIFEALRPGPQQRWSAKEHEAAMRKKFQSVALPK